MIHTSGLLRVTDVIKDLRCGVVTIVTMLVDQRNDYSACSTLTCFRGFLHYDMTRSVLYTEKLSYWIRHAKRTWSCLS